MYTVYSILQYNFIAKLVGNVFAYFNNSNVFLVQGKQYFTCPENYGIFVRQSQLTVLTNADSSPPQKPSTSRLPTPGIPKPSVSRIPGATTPSKEKVKEEKDGVS